MTMPSERYRSVMNTRDFLLELLDPKKTPRIPKKLRDRAYWCLKHYPWEMYMEETAKKVPEIWEKPK